MSNANQLEIPGAAKMDGSSFEIVRVWIANNGQQVSLMVGVWNDPAAWGMMLADLARHIARAYAQDADIDARQALDRIRSAFDIELESQGDETSGEIMA